MKFALFLSLIALQSALLGNVRAEKADARQPTNVEADQMAYDEAKRINTFTGKVVLTRGTLTMRAGRVVVTTDPDGHQFATLHAAPGALATFRQKRDGGPDLWIDGQAERIEYDGKTEVTKMFSKAQLRRLEGNKVTDEVNGETITYDSRAEYYTVNNGPGGEGKPNSGRVRVTIQPRVDTKDE